MDHSGFQWIWSRKFHPGTSHWRQKKHVREKLLSEEGYALSMRRMTETETVFGTSRTTGSFKRFLLRSLSKVSLEVGWLSLAQNMLKKAAIDAEIQGAERKRSA
jgi:hypothetical protein